MHSHDEELLEPAARFFRFKKGLESIPKNKPVTIADLGCGPKVRFYHFAKKHGAKLKEYIGIDPLIREFPNSRDLKVIKSPLKKKILLPSNSVDYVVGFAFLEHIDYPEDMISESIRILKKNGKAIFTTPTFRAQKLLEFLAFKMGIISKREILEHRQYFNEQKLYDLVNKHDKNKVNHSYFELGLNNLLIITK